MKKLLSFILALALAAIAGNVFADESFSTTVNAKSTNLDYNSGGAVAVTDQTNGYTARVTSEGSIVTEGHPGTIVEGIDAHELFSGLSVVSSAARLKKIIYGGPSSAAGDYLLVYDATSATGTPKLDLSVGTAQATYVVDLEPGVTFSTGIYAKADSASGLVATFVYDN